MNIADELRDLERRLRALGPAPSMRGCRTQDDFAEFRDRWRAYRCEQNAILNKLAEIKRVTRDQGPAEVPQ